jgi:hypothetical protein
MERLRLSISFKKEHKHLFEYLQTVPNKSDFIGKTIDAYISGGRHSPVSNDEIRKIVMEILQSQGGLSPALSQSSPPADSMISEDDITLIADLF